MAEAKTVIAPDQPILVNKVSGEQGSQTPEGENWKQVDIFAGGPIQANGNHRRLVDQDGKVRFTYEVKPEET